jgi:hypothetical protein
VISAYLEHERRASMSMTSDQDAIRPVIRQGQIIVVALIAGVVVFLVIATMADLGPNPGAAAVAAGGAGAGAQGAGQPSQTVPFITYSAIAFGAFLLPMSFILPDLVAKNQRQAIIVGKGTSGTNPKPSLTSATTSQATKTAAGDMDLAFLNQLIVGAAMLEGAAFFAGVAYLVERNPIALAVALVLLAALVARFPTANRVERWTERQREKLREEQLDGLSSS